MMEDESHEDPVVHIHRGMTGSFPLRMAEIFFRAKTVFIAEYSYITPLLGLLTGQHKRDANAMEKIRRRGGHEAVLERADKISELNYSTVIRIDIYKGGTLGRPKISITDNNASYEYRIHGQCDPVNIYKQIRSLRIDEQADIHLHNGLGYSPITSFQRFF